MRVILATETYLPTLSGVVVFTQNLAEELVKRGHEVAIFAPSSHRAFTHEVREGIHIYRFPSFPVPFRTKSRFTIRQYRRVEGAVKRFKPDIVHLQSPSGVPAAVQRIARREMIPIIGTHHFSLEFILAYLKPLAFINSVTHRALVTYLNRFYRRCGFVTCPTESIKKNLEEAGITVPLHVISNGVRFSDFNKASTVKAPALPFPKVPLVLYVGRIDQDKNIPVMLRTIPLVVARTPVHYVFAGSGNRLSAAKRWVRSHGMDEHVTFLGKIPHQSALLRAIYKAARVFVIPSSIETQSLGTLEALASGLPVVASNAGALPELVHHGENGFLVGSEDSEGFAQRITELAQNAEQAQSMGLRGVEIARTHDLPRVVDEFIQLYQGYNQTL